MGNGFKQVMYRAGPLEPVVAPGGYVVLQEQTQLSLYQVEFVEPLSPSGPLKFNFGAIAALTQGNVNTLAQLLDVDYGQIVHYRARLEDDFNVVVSQPFNVQRGSIIAATSRWSLYNALRDRWDTMQEFIQLENLRANFQPANPTNYARPINRIQFYGYRYLLGRSTGTGSRLPPVAKYPTVPDAVRGVEGMRLDPAEVPWMPLGVVMR